MKEKKKRLRKEKDGEKYEQKWKLGKKYDLN